MKNYFGATKNKKKTFAKHEFAAAQDPAIAKFRPARL